MDTVDLTFDNATLNVVMQGLNELPYRLSAPVIENLHKQIAAAVAKAQKANDNEKEEE